MIKVIRECDSLFSSVNEYYGYNRFEYDNYDGYAYVSIPDAKIIDSLYLSGNHRTYHLTEKNFNIHKDSIDIYPFEDIQKTLKINTKSIENLVKLMIKHEVRNIYTIGPGDCQTCPVLIVFRNDQYYVREHLWDYCYPDWCFSNYKAKTKKLTQDIQLIKNGKKLYNN